MDDKLKILRPGLVVVECGAAPGSWTQVVVQRINSDGKLNNKSIGKAIGIDLLPIAPLQGAFFLPNSDFTSPETQRMIKAILKGNPHPPDPSQEQENINAQETISDDTPLVDLVLSDMAPNATGQRETNHYRIITLAQAALRFAIENGKTGSHFLTKLFDGGETKNFEKLLLSRYKEVRTMKPPCSRNDSSELFLFARSKLL